MSNLAATFARPLDLRPELPVEWCDHAREEPALETGGVGSGEGVSGYKRGVSPEIHKGRRGPGELDCRRDRGGRTPRPSPPTQPHPTQPISGRPAAGGAAGVGGMEGGRYGRGYSTQTTKWHLRPAARQAQRLLPARARNSSIQPSVSNSSTQPRARNSSTQPTARNSSTPADGGAADAKASPRAPAASGGRGRRGTRGGSACSREPQGLRGGSERLGWRCGRRCGRRCG